jgi:cyanophycinase
VNRTLRNIVRAGWRLGEVALALVLVGGAEAAPANGRLIICGGGLDLKERFIYEAMTARIADTSGTVGIVPTASADPEDSVKAYVDDFSKVIGPGRTEGVPLTTATADNARDEAVAARIRQHDVLFFTGGDQSRITQVFLPDGEPTPAYKAVLEVLAKGGTVGGSSAGAAMMSDPMLTWGTSSGALKDGVRPEEDSGVGIGKGMGLFPYGMTDQHFLKRSRYGRFVVALEAAKVRFGYGVDEQRAIEADLATSTVTTLGPQALALLDMGEMRRNGNSRTLIRVSLLGSGDKVDASTGEVTPAEGRKSLAPIINAAQPLSLDDAWADYALTKCIEALAAGAPLASAQDANFEIRVTRDNQTRFWTNEVDGKPVVSAHRVRLDIVEKGSGQ